VTRSQCLAAGLGDEAVAWRVASGRWLRVLPGVYLTMPGREGWEVMACAAFLHAQGSHRVAAALVGRSAAVAWGLAARAPSVVEVGIPENRRVVAPEGVRVRRIVRFAECLDPLLYPWRTSLPATVVDCAASGNADEAIALVARAVQRDRTSAASLVAELGARPRHRHRALLTEVLGDIESGAHSAAEVRYVRDVERAHGLPVGSRQVPGRSGVRRRHDTGYRRLGVVVEVDGRLGHEGWADRVRDGRRDRSAAAEGDVTLRVFWPDVAVTPCRTALDVGATLSAHGWTGRPHPCRRRDCAVRTAGGAAIRIPLLPGHP
jgi:predicted transcriptional regulator of viral defense system